MLPKLLWGGVFSYLGKKFQGIIYFSILYFWVAEFITPRSKRSYMRVVCWSASCCILLLQQARNQVGIGPFLKSTFSIFGPHSAEAGYGPVQCYIQAASLLETHIYPAHHLFGEGSTEFFIRLQSNLGAVFSWGKGAVFSWGRSSHHLHEFLPFSIICEEENDSQNEILFRCCHLIQQAGIIWWNG